MDCFISEICSKIPSWVGHGVGEANPSVLEVKLGIELAHEDVAKNPPRAHGEVEAHEAADALGDTELSHLET